MLISGASVAETSFRVQRADHGQVFVSAHGGLRSRVLFAAGDPRQPETYEVTFAPRCIEDAPAHAPDTFEHLIVLRGALTVRAEARATLGVGDTLFFRADLPHVYENPGDEQTLVHLT